MIKSRYNIKGQLVEKIVKKKDGYYVQSEDGKKNLGGPYKKIEDAERRLGQVEYFKNKDKKKVTEVYADDDLVDDETLDKLRVWEVNHLPKGYKFVDLNSVRKVNTYSDKGRKYDLIMATVNYLTDKRDGQRVNYISQHTYKVFDDGEVKIIPHGSLYEESKELGLKETFKRKTISKKLRESMHTVTNFDFDIQPWGTWVEIELQDGSSLRGDVHLNLNPRNHKTNIEGNYKWDDVENAIKQLLQQKYNYKVSSYKKVLDKEELEKSSIDFNANESLKEAINLPHIDNLFRVEFESAKYNNRPPYRKGIDIPYENIYILADSINQIKRFYKNNLFGKSFQFGDVPAYQKFGKLLDVQEVAYGNQYQINLQGGENSALSDLKSGTKLANTLPAIKLVDVKLSESLKEASGIPYDDASVRPAIDTINRYRDSMTKEYGGSKIMIKGSDLPRSIKERVMNTIAKDYPADYDYWYTDEDNLPGVDNAIIDNIKIIVISPTGKKIVSLEHAGEEIYPDRKNNSGYVRNAYGYSQEDQSVYGFTFDTAKKLLEILKPYIRRTSESLNESPDRFGIPTDDDLEQEFIRKKEKAQADRQAAQQKEEEKKNYLTKFAYYVKDVVKEYIPGIKNALKNNKLYTGRTYENSNYRSWFISNGIMSKTFGDLYRMGGEIKIKYNLDNDKVTLEVRGNPDEEIEFLKNHKDRLTDYLDTASKQIGNDFNSNIRQLERCGIDTSGIDGIADISNPGHWHRGSIYVVFSIGNKFYWFEGSSEWVDTFCQIEDPRNLKYISNYDEYEVIRRFRNVDEFNKSLKESVTEGYESLTEKVSPEGYAPKQMGKAYKVFKVKNGKLYPPMVANAGGADTPIGVWLDAEEGEFAGLSKTGRPQVKSTGSGNLAYRPGWHLGDVPRAPQFDRKNKETGEMEFPADFVWAECDYAMDVNYQPEADERGYMRTKVDADGNVSSYRSDKYQHSLAGLPKLPTNGYYKYRTNPRPDTVPWVITGQMKVNRILSDDEVNEILKKNGIAPIHRQGGDKTLKELGLKEGLEESMLKEDKIKASGFKQDDYSTPVETVYSLRDGEGNMIAEFKTKREAINGITPETSYIEYEEFDPETGEPWISKVVWGKKIEESMLKEDKKIWGSDSTLDYYYNADIEELRSELEDRGVDPTEYEDWSDEQVRDYFVQDDYNDEIDYEDFKYNILPNIDSKCYADVLVLFGDAANWRGTRGAAKVLHKVEDLMDYVYPNFEATTDIFEDEIGTYYTQSTHDTPMGGTKMYLYSLKSEEDLDKLTEYFTTPDGWFDPEYDYAAEFLEEHTDYNDIKELIDKGILTPIKDIGM